MEILNDPGRMKVLEEENSEQRKARSKEQEKEVAYFGVFGFWIYGLIIAVSGVMYLRGGHEVEIDSPMLRLVILIVFIVAGYQYLKRVINK